jgi:hypothetical protein
MSQKKVVQSEEQWWLGVQTSKGIKLLKLGQDTKRRHKMQMKQEKNGLNNIANRQK